MNKHPTQQRQVVRRKKTSQPKRNPFSITQMKVSSRTPFPKSQRVRFRAIDNYRLANGSTIQQNQVFRLNSLYDYDYTGTGKQPFQFDQLTAVYNKYRVLTCSYKITFINNASVPAYVCVYPDNVSSNISPLSSAAYQPFARYGLLGCNGGPSKMVLSKQLNIASVLGYDLNVDDDLASLYSTNPTQVAFLHMCVDSLPTAALVFDVCILVELDFYAEMYDLKNPGDSLFKQPQLQEESEDEVITTKQLQQKKLQKK